ncbi:MAG: alpha/beta fold hydrolase [Chloroflexi bacterium]|nr:alpha/beta fold hydrolase [Chloroflexota bacterium]
MTEISFFHEEIYQPFYWQGGRQAALLVHGFPGTPAEVRPLAEALFAQGWTVQAPLLPGFGTQIDKLFDQTRENWVTAVAEAHAALRANHDAVLLVGYSMGGAIALNVAAQVPPDRLVLLAPFWRIGTEVHQAIWQGVKRFIPEFQLFKRVDFTDPRMQKAFGAVFPISIWRIRRFRPFCKRCGFRHDWSTRCWPWGWRPKKRPGRFTPPHWSSRAASTRLFRPRRRTCCCGSWPGKRGM